MQPLKLRKVKLFKNLIILDSAFLFVYEFFFIFVEQLLTAYSRYVLKD